MLTNAFLAEWTGSYSWSIPSAPVELFEFAEDNIAHIDKFEGYNIAGRSGRKAAYALLSCRIERPASLPGRPGVVYHHALIADSHTDPELLVERLRCRYSNPLGFTRSLYRAIGNLQPASESETLEGVSKELRSVTVPAQEIEDIPRRTTGLGNAANDRMTTKAAADPKQPSPQKEQATDLQMVARYIGRLLIFNLVILSIILATVAYGLIDMKRAVSADLDDISDRVLSLHSAILTAQSGKALGTEKDPALSHPGLYSALESGEDYVLSDLPSGSRLDANVLPTLRELGHILQGTGWRVKIEIHTDQSKEDANKHASQLRANLISDFLIQKGIPRSHFQVEDLGKSNPIVQIENDAAAASRNRRLVIRRLPDTSSGDG